MKHTHFPIFPFGNILAALADGVRPLLPPRFAMTARTYQKIYPTQIILISATQEPGALVDFSQTSI